MGTQLPSQKGAHPLPTNFRPMSIVTERSPISATPEHLLCSVWFSHSKPRDWLGERLRNDILCVEWVAKPSLGQLLSLAVFLKQTLLWTVVIFATNVSSDCHLQLFTLYNHITCTHA